MIIAIDGPAAAGKGTLARKIANHFKLHYLDTGSLYRGEQLVVFGHYWGDGEADVSLKVKISGQDKVMTKESGK